MQDGDDLHEREVARGPSISTTANLLCAVLHAVGWPARSKVTDDIADYLALRPLSVARSAL